MPPPTAPIINAGPVLLHIGNSFSPCFSLMRLSFTRDEIADAPIGYPPRIPRINGVKAYASVNGIFLKGFLISLAKSSANPIELINPEIKKKGRSEGMIIFAHVFNPSLTAFEAPEGFDMRAHNETAMMHALNNLNIDFFK